MEVVKHVAFNIPGVPVAKGRPRFSNGRSYTPQKTVEYENLVKVSYMQAGHPKLDGNLHAVIEAYFPIPKSARKKEAQLMREGKIMHGKRPDCDNIAKSILDALNMIAFDDDSQVSIIEVRKKYSDEPRAEVQLFAIEEGG